MVGSLIDLLIIANTAVWMEFNFQAFLNFLTAVTPSYSNVWK